MKQQLLALALMLSSAAAIAAERVQVVTSFSILADMVENVGGEHVEVTEGLKAGEQVVVVGQNNLSEGVKVNVAR